ncbi:hypothetical protein AU252_20410 [Pseudarthrobacter sulfonivorans]|uniref:Uncharacterized protein n=1 Tax=Pseudarthrobacter sulfonivorans TaxID=121292 RepID=A0A0U3P222_9MICC|nr:hypothetical protein [Pseudarthrobacter sulfonivorans]ALV43231.1 hypothetical protein AU252_20410 [Pseudarthrobacter sulfonivorans]
MTRYEKMGKREAAAALQEFLDERPRALEALTEFLSERGGEAVTLDESVDSLVPLWRWVKSVLTEQEAGATLPESDAPSWLRYGIGTEPTLSPESVAIVDAVISYLCRVVERGAPRARWRVGHHRIKSYMWQNHPVLASDGEEVALAQMVPGTARGQVSGSVPSADDKLARTAAALIEALNGGNEDMVAEDEPIVEVEDLADDELRGRELEVSLREDIVHEHNRVVGRMIKALKQEDGITRVIREDHEVLLVATTDWSTDRLHEWVAGYLEENVRD